MTRRLLACAIAGGLTLGIGAAMKITEQVCRDIELPPGVASPKVGHCRA